LVYGWATIHEKHTGFDLQVLNVSEILQLLEFNFFRKVYRQPIVMDPKTKAEEFSEVDGVQSSRTPKSYRQNDIYFGMIIFSSRSKQFFMNLIHFMILF
jgi:hypothetical protein